MSLPAVRVEYVALPHQLAALRSRKRFVAMLCGLGGGKTDVGTIWTLMHSAADPPDVRYALLSNTYTQLHDGALANFYKNLHAFAVPVRPEHPPESKGPMDMRIWIEGHWRRILCRSLEHPERLHGPEFGRIWVDEASFAKPEGLKVASDRLRDARVDIAQMLITTTKDDPRDSWLYETFVTRYDAALHEVIEARTEDNPHLPPDYAQNIRAIRSARECERLLDNKWVSDVGGEVYSAFDRSLHVNAELAEYDPALPIHWWLDFNIGQGKPMSSCLAQIKKGPSWVTGKVRPYVTVFAEFILDSTDTRDLVSEAQESEWLRAVRPGDVLLSGDASGRSRDTRSKTTDYGILADAGFTRQDVPLSNPPIRTRHNAVNAMLQAGDGDVRTAIHPRCATLARGLETVRLRSGASYLEQETYDQHVTTAFGYGVCRRFSLGGPKIEQGKR